MACRVRSSRRGSGPRGLPVALALACLVAGPASTRSAENEELRAAVVPIVSTDPARLDDGDLEPLVPLLTDARVVALGEMTHGDGTAFLVRTRLVRFLHERLGFDVLAFESGLLECERVMDALRDDVPLGEALQRGIHDVWAHSAEMRPLFEYVRATQDTDRPLRLVGFDPQFSAPDAGDLLRDGLEDVLEPDAAVAAELDALLADLADLSATITADEFDRWSALLDDLADELRGSPRDPSGLWRQALVSVGWQLRGRRLAATAPPLDFADLERSLRAAERVEAGNARDRGMAENLLWHLDQRWPGSRVVIWAANNHVRTATSRRAADDPGVAVLRMGERLHDVLGDALHTVVTTCYQGAWASPSLRSADGRLSWREGVHEPAGDGTLAAALHETGLQAAWLDLASASQRVPWLASPLTLREDFDGGPPRALSDSCDAILFLDSIEPATPVDEPPGDGSR